LWHLGGLLLGAVAGLAVLAPVAEAQGTKAKKKELVVLDEMKKEQHPPVHVVAFSSDGRFLAAGGQNVHVWDMSEKEPKEYAVCKTDIFFGLWGLAFSPDGKWLAVGGHDDDHSVRFWDMTAAKPKQEYRLKEHAASCTSIAFSPDGKLMASGGNDRAVILWDVEGDKPKVKDTIRVEDAKKDEVHSVAFSPNGKMLAAACRNGSVRTWDVSGGKPKPGILLGEKELGEKELGNISNPRIAYSPDSRLLAISGGKAVRIWGSKGVVPRAGHTERTNCVAFAPDGKSLASVGEDGRIVLWDTVTGKPLVSKEKPGKYTSVAFAPLPTNAKPDSEMTLAASTEGGAIWILKIGYKEP
jgi:WD40 repeat protein